MVTVQDLVKTGLELCNVIAAGETPSAADADTGLKTFQSLLDAWSVENLAIYSVKRKVFELTSGKESYTIGMGVGADFVSLRPMTFDGSSIGLLRKEPVYTTPEPTEEDPDPVPVISGYNLFVDQEIPIDVIDQQRWIGLTNKSLISGSSNYIYPAGGTENAEFFLYPVPVSYLGLVLYSKNALAQVENLSDELDLPPGYRAAFEYNLAVELSFKFSRNLDPRVELKADQLKRNVKTKNSRTPRLISDVRRGKQFCIRLGE